jgi:distribution and morphology protein 31
MKMDDIIALFSWIFVSNSVFILVGTTTFCSILLFLANTLSFQEYLGKRVCEFMTKLTGYNISFQTAIVPRWREGTIRLGNVNIKCNDKSWALLCEKKAIEDGKNFEPEKVNRNFTYWEITVDHIDITLSLWRWLDGIYV